jgi:tetratricopeptide (TPR) repeat protein
MRRIHSNVILGLLGGLLAGGLLAGLSSCGENDEAATAAEAKEAEEDAAEREKKAARLFATAQGAVVPEKIGYYRKLISLYPYTQFVKDAHLRLVLYLVDPAVNELEQALEAAETFGHPHPTHGPVSEAYRYVANRWPGSPEKTPTKVLQTWRSFLDQARGRDDLNIDDKGWFWYETAVVAAWSGDLEEGTRFLEEAFSWEMDKNVLVRIAYQLGLNQAAAGKHAAARKSLEKALALTDDGAKGVSGKTVRQELDKLPAAPAKN